MLLNCGGFIFPSPMHTLHPTVINRVIRTECDHRPSVLKNSPRFFRNLWHRLSIIGGALGLAISIGQAQMVDRTQAPNIANEGIAKSFTQEVGAGRGDVLTPDSSAFIIARDPFRAVRRGRELFQRKYTVPQGVGPITANGHGDLNTIRAIGAGLTDSCASCHGRPRGAAGFGGDVATRPDSRDAPHLFGLGLKEMLADEITHHLRELRAKAITQAAKKGKSVEIELTYQGINYGWIRSSATGVVDTSRVKGVDSDLRVRPFFAHGQTISIREFVIGALNDEMGLQAVDPQMIAARAGARYTTPSGMVLDGATDHLEGAAATLPNTDPDGDGVINEIPTSIVDYYEFYLLNYFKPARYEETPATIRGRRTFAEINCVRCHVPDLKIENDRRVADLQTEFDSEKGNFNGMFATAVPLFDTVNDGTGLPSLKRPKGGSFLVKNIFTDFKRHDLGPAFYERNYDGTTQQQFMTTPLWGVGTTAPYGHDGRSINLTEVILRHGGEAKREANEFAELRDDERRNLLEFLQSLVLFPPDDTASNLDPGNRNDPAFPQKSHGSIKLTALFNNPADPE